MLELLLGLSLVSITILAIFSIFPMADRSVSLADRTAQANYIARSLMEERLAKPYDELPVTVTPELGEVTLQHSQRRGQPLSTTYDYQIEISQPLPDRQLKHIVITVGWRRGSFDAARNVRLKCDKGTLW